GLGLAIARRHVELMGGQLVLESAPGAGARFSFELLLPDAEGMATAGQRRWSQVKHLAAALQVRYAFVTQFSPEPTPMVRMLAYWAGDAFAQNEEYELAHANLGNMYSTIKRYDEGIASFKRAIELKPHYEFAWNGLGFIYEMQAEELIAAGNTEGGRAKYSEALAAYTKASEINPNKAETFYSIGLMQWRLENWQGVVTAWEKCLKLNPNHQSANEWLPKAKEKLQGR
ncbi:tetratricopeptide repeat protein, partial [bacterium]|nr:tetratricopeptide repeat protein [bacterium]